MKYFQFTLKTLILFLALSAFSTALNAQERRPIDSEHPMWLVHVDVWNQADPQKIINLIPDDIKPFVVMNLSLSCSYDKEQDVYMRPQNAIRTYKSWASVCQNNGMWFTLQPASGGHTHIQDNDLETFEYFFKRYPNFLGWNYAEQFWGFNAAGDKSSSSDVTRIALFAKLVEMHHNYGGVLTISFCGNIWSHPLNPVGMMKRNSDLLDACKKYPDAILWLYKYTTSSCFYNNESVCFGPFVAGLAKNYGVRYDNCGWNGSLDDFFAKDSDGNIIDKTGRNKLKYPVSAGIGTVMEQTCRNGGAVWDGPELIWTEDFQNLSNTTVNGYTRRNWGTYPGFRNIWLDMWHKIIDGTMYIPTRQEVVDNTKFIIVNDVKTGSDEDKYATWADLYDGLYKQTDPFNRGNGQWMQNYLYLKSTGRYGTIPMAPCINDEIGAQIPNKVKKSQRTSVWSSQSIKTAKFNNAYPVISTGDLYVSRMKNQLITYTPYSYMNSKTTAKANIPLQYNTCESMDLTYGKLSSGIIREYADHIDLYLNNYRADTTKNVTDIVVINGASSKPTFTSKKRVEATGTVTEAWDEATKKYTLTVNHNGPFDITVNCAGTATERSTDYAPNKALSTPKQPEQFVGEFIVEAEDMDYRYIKENVNNAYYSGYSWVRGHAGNGFAVMGTNSSSALTTVFKAHKAGDYTITVRYMNTAKKGNIRVRSNNTTAQTSLCELTGKNKWKKVTSTHTLNEGDNTIYIFNNSSIDMIIDQVIITPAEQEAEKFGVSIRESVGGTVIPSETEAAEGTTVTLSAQPQEGYELKGFNIIHGDITLNDDNTFVMPDDNVTLEPIFADQTAVYELDFTNTLAGSIPEGWRTVDGETVQQYPNSYGSGPRTMGGFTGSYNKALYWRTTGCDYGKQTNYKLTLEPGDYKLTYAMAAWKGTPQFKAQILTSAGSTLKESAYFTATPNAGGVSSANLSSAIERELAFTVTNKGDYIINFANSGTGFSEFLLLSCRINKVVTPTEIESVVIGDAANEEFEIYDVNGIRLPSLQRGINIIRRNGFEYKKIYIK